jgi:hypothetical protein
MTCAVVRGSSLNSILLAAERLLKANLAAVGECQKEAWRAAAANVELVSVLWANPQTPSTAPATVVPACGVGVAPMFHECDLRAYPERT